MMVLTEAQIDDMRTSLHLVKQPFTPEAIDSLCDMAKGILPTARAEERTISAGGVDRMYIGGGIASLFTIHVDPALPRDVAEIRATPDGPVLCRIINLAAL